MGSPNGNKPVTRMRRCSMRSGDFPPSHYTGGMKIEPVHIIGGGMAGSEAAWQAANLGVPVVLHEMRPVRTTDAHHTDALAELVCSNSFRSDDWEHNAVGLLHQEMRKAGGLIITVGDRHKVPAGSALAVDRDGFSADVTASSGGASAGDNRTRRSGRLAARGVEQRHCCDRPADIEGTS